MYYDTNYRIKSLITLFGVRGVIFIFQQIHTLATFLSQKIQIFLAKKNTFKIWEFPKKYNE